MFGYYHAVLMKLINGTADYFSRTALKYHTDQMHHVSTFIQQIQFRTNQLLVEK